MTLKLNVYKNGEVEKTYEREEARLITGACVDILDGVDIEKMLDGQLTDEKMAKEIIKLVVKSFSSFKLLIQAVFIGLTDDEYRRTDVVEVADVVIKVVRYSLGRIYRIGAGKN